MPYLVNRFFAYAMAAVAVLAGVASLCLFVLFAAAGGLDLVDLRMEPHTALAFDAFLSFIFFAQHSGMVRQGFRDCLGKAVPAPYHGAVYTIASAAALVLLSVFWQPSHVILVVPGGPSRWVARVLLLAALAGFVWGVCALRHFDVFGAHALLSRTRTQQPQPDILTIRGPYRWVRHPFYFSAMLALWATPVLSADRLLLNTLFTAWIVAGAVLEERDLVRKFDGSYQAYQRQVPMLVPWRLPATRPGETSVTTSSGTGPPPPPASW